MTQTRLCLSEKQFIHYVNTLKNVTIYVLKGFDEKFLAMHNSSFRRLREQMKKKNIKVKVIDSKLKNTI